MGDIVTEADSVYRDRESPGSRIRHEPVKSEIRHLFGTVEAAAELALGIAAYGVKWTTQAIRVRSTGNVVIASALENGDTLNGVVLATGNFVFLGKQTAPAENGLYLVNASGAATRATFADTAAELAHIGFVIGEGTVGAGERYTLDMEAADITVGTTALNFALIGIEVDYSNAIDARLDVVEERTSIPGDLGAVNVKASDAVADAEYVDRTVLSDQPTASVDLTNTANREVALNTGIDAPTTRATAANVGGKLRVTFVLAANIMGSAITMQRAVVGRVYRMSGEVITQTSGPGFTGTWAIGVCLSPTAPTPGATVGDAPADTVCIQYRQNSALQAQVYNDSDAGEPAPGVTLSVTTAPGGAWDVTKPVDIQIEITEADAATISFLQDNRLMAETKAEGFEPDSYIGVMARSSSGSGDVVEFSDIEYFAPSLDVPKRINLDPGVGAVGGIGTESRPFETWNEGVDSYDIDKARRTLRMTLKGGIWNDASFRLPRGFKDVRIVGARGSRPIIRGSVDVAAAAGWSLVSGNVWKLANPGAARGVGGLIQTDVNSTFGQAGGYTADYALYARQVPQTTPATLLPGEMTAHFTGTHAGTLLVRTWADDDPNDHTWRFATRETVIEALGEEGGWNDQVLSLRNLNVEDGYVYGLRCDMIEVDIEDVDILSTMVGNGADFKDTIGSVRNFTSRGTYSDCIHANDSDADVSSVLRFEQCVAEGGFYYVNNGVSIFADAWSNHIYNPWHLIDCRGNSGGKDGFSLASTSRLVNCDADDNKDSGIKLSGTLPGTKLLDVKGGRLTGNGGYGALIVGTDADLTLNATLDGVYFAGNGLAHARIAVTGSGALDLIRSTFDNTDGAPTGGNITSSGGTVTERGSETLT